MAYDDCMLSRTDLMKIAVENPFGVDEVEAAYGMFLSLARNLRLSESKAENFLQYAITTATENQQSLYEVANRFCEILSPTAPVPALPDPMLRKLADLTLTITVDPGSPSR